MSEATLQKILEAYGVSYQLIQPSQKGYRNSSYPVLLTTGRTINLILYKPESDMLARIQRANRVANSLAAQGLPTRQSVDHRIIRLSSGNIVKYGALYNYLPGETIPWEAYTKQHLKLAGMAMSIMHQRLRSLGDQKPYVTDEYQTINQRMWRYFADQNVQTALLKKLQLSLEEAVFHKNMTLLQLCHSLPNQQMLHMDFVRSNLLFASAQAGDRFVEKGLALSGVLDFEKTAFGHPLFDIARTLAFLLVDCKYKTPDEIKKYFLRSGYAKRGGVVLQNVVFRQNTKRIDAFDGLVELFLLHDFYKFLRHNPYESLPQNEHFMRTRDMLLARQMIQYR
ncbi:MAG TPA: phosphotransferase [Candidatus Saccharimonadales bacterium]